MRGALPGGNPFHGKMSRWVQQLSPCSEHTGPAAPSRACISETEKRVRWLSCRPSAASCRSRAADSTTPAASAAAALPSGGPPAGPPLTAWPLQAGWGRWWVGVDGGWGC